MYMWREFVMLLISQCYTVFENKVAMIAHNEDSRHSD